jgi:HK97 family phage major capsid protein
MTRIEALRSAINAKVERSNQLRSALQEYATRDGDPTDEERTQFEADVAEFEAAGPDLERMQGELRQLEQIANAPERARETPHVPQVQTRHDALEFGVEYRSVADVRAAARTAIEQIPHVDDETRSAMTRTLERADTPSGSLARHMIAASRSEYRSAFPKLISGREYTLTADEIRAVEAVRAVTLTDANGGYLVPTVVDPTIIITGTHNGMLGVNPLRQQADVRQISGDNLTVVSSGGVTVEWVAEGQESTDNAPTFSTLTLTPYRANCFVPYSIEAEQDWPGLEATIRRLIAIAKDDEEAAVFTTGSGVGRPLGLITDIVANYTGQIQASASADTFAVADLYALRNKVAPRYQGRASWMANQLIYDKVRQFDTAGGANFWVDLNGANPPSLMGQSAYVNPAMDGTYGSGENYVMVYGDFSGYTIVDRIGLTVEPIRHLFGGTNNFPNGMRGIWAYWRTGGRVTNSESLAVLNVT